MAKSSVYRGVTLFRPTGKWRAQISAAGKTTSLGDHDTEEEAARAFDRAAINKGGFQAKTNFNVMEYAAELEQLQSMGQAELVQMLRSRARKSGTQTSNYRGVSLLKQTKKWHAQINVSGKQVHLGFFPSEEQAARAYDRAAINKGAREGTKIITNFHILEYEHELGILCSITQQEIVDALASEARRKGMMELLASGALDKAEALFGRTLVCTKDRAAIEQLKAGAERAVPKLQHLERWALPPGSAGSTMPVGAAGTRAVPHLGAPKDAAPPKRAPPRKKPRRKASSDDEDYMSEQDMAAKRRRRRTAVADEPEEEEEQEQDKADASDEEACAWSPPDVRRGRRSVRKRISTQALKARPPVLDLPPSPQPAPETPGSKLHHAWTLQTEPPSPLFGFSPGLLSPASAFCGPGFVSPGLVSPGLCSPSFMDVLGLTDLDSLAHLPPLLQPPPGQAPQADELECPPAAAPGKPPSASKAVRLGSGRTSLRHDAVNGKTHVTKHSQRLVVDVAAVVTTGQTKREDCHDGGGVHEAGLNPLFDGDASLPIIGDSPLPPSVLHIGPAPSTPRACMWSPSKLAARRAATSGDDSPSKGSCYSPGQPTGSGRRTFKRPERAVM